MNLPNALTIFRIGLVPVFNYLFWIQSYRWALVLFLVAGGTDFLDGLIARRLGRKTVLGAVLDPAADKFLMTVTFITLSARGVIPVWLTALVIFRDVYIVLGVAYLKSRKRKLVFEPTLASKWNTFLQLMLLLLIFCLYYLMAEPEVFQFVSRDLLQKGLAYGVYVVAGMTLLTGFQYTKVGLQILGSSKNADLSA